MNHRHLIALLSLLALPAASFADDAAVVAGVKGDAIVKVASQSLPIKASQSLESGSIIQTGNSGFVKISLPGGGHLVVAAKSRVKIKTARSSETTGLYVVEIIVTSGTVYGNAPQGSAASRFIVRTAAGVANLTGSTFSVNFAPTPGQGGSLNVAVVSGSGSFTPIGATSSSPIDAGTHISLVVSGTTSGSIQTLTLSISRIREITNSLKGEFPSTSGSTTSTSTADSTPGKPKPSENEDDESKKGNGTLTLDVTLITNISPNGEGLIGK